MRLTKAIKESLSYWHIVQLIVNNRFLFLSISVLEKCNRYRPDHWNDPLESKWKRKSEISSSEHGRRVGRVIEMWPVIFPIKFLFHISWLSPCLCPQSIVKKAVPEPISFLRTWINLLLFAFGDVSMGNDPLAAIIGQQWLSFWKVMGSFPPRGALWRLFKSFATYLVEMLGLFHGGSGSSNWFVKKFQSD